MTRRSEKIHKAQDKVAKIQARLDETQRALQKADETDQAVTSVVSSPWIWIALFASVGLILGFILWRRLSR